MERIYDPSDFGSGFSNHQEDSVTTVFLEENICGEGASCVVYRMRLGGLRVAVKRLRPEYLTNPAFVSSYRKEFQIGQRLKHDGLPIYRDFREDINEVYMVMDYIDGISLEEFLLSDEGKRYFNSKENVRRFLTELIGVVSYLHRSGVIHCDLKPANIMLRHSDRGVMLIDLDKAYSDSLDQTHGGTSHFSNPLDAGSTPKVSKDYAALGRLVDLMSEDIPAFPRRTFAGFQRLCLKSDIAPETLIQAIKAPSSARNWIVAGLAACVGMALIWNLNKGSDPAVQNESTQVQLRDTVMIVTKVQEAPTQDTQSSGAVPLEPKSVPSLTVDAFDAGMSGFIKQAESSIQALASGSLTDGEIQSLTSKMVEGYTSAYNDLLQSYKTNHPEVASLEADLLFAKVSESSNATGLFKQVTRAAADTIKLRNPELYEE